jgi:hypothetical protein
VLDKFEKFNSRLSDWFEWVGMVGLLLVMLVTNTDVIGAKLFLWPLRGTIDILIIWRLCVLGYSFQTGGETTATAHIPVYPFAYGAALASIPVCLVLLHELLSSLARVVKR